MSARVVQVAVARAGGVPAGDGWLTPAEREVQRGMRFAKRRRDWRLGRWAGKHAVAAHLEAEGRVVDAWDVEIMASGGGAPEARLRNHGPAPALSLSHSGNVALAAAASVARLGCDVEALAPRSPALVADHFTETERTVIDRSDPAWRAVLTNLVWSAKESALKALREGLRLDTRAVRVDTAPLDARALEAARASGAWRPLGARESGGEAFVGWFRLDAAYVWTVLAGQPIALAVHDAPVAVESSR